MGRRGELETEKDRGWGRIQRGRNRGVGREERQKKWNREGEREKEERREGTKRRPMLESALALRVAERTGCFYGDSLESLGKVTLKL